MKKYIKNYLIFFVALTLFASCATAKFDVASFEKAYSEGNYELCIKLLKKRNYGKDSVPLKNMDIAVLSHYAKNYSESQKHFAE